MLKIVDLTLDYLDAFVESADKNIGQGYFSREKAKELITNAFVNGKTASLLLVDDEIAVDKNQIVGFRITLPPGKWTPRHPSQAPHPELWKVDKSKVGYFQSLFLDDRIQGQGWGKKLSQLSIARLREMGAEAVVCHSWDESPANSSGKYLTSLGFQPVVSIPHFWKVVDYKCTRCGKPCLCTATEMILYLL